MKKSLLLTTLFCSFTITAEPVVVGKPLPEVEIKVRRGGELTLQNDELKYQDWNSSNLRDKTRVVYHLAARWGIEQWNARSVENLGEILGELSGLPFAVTTILNSDDVTFGASGAAQKEFEKSRKLHSEAESEFILDKKSAAQEAWELNRKSSTLIIVDKNNLVLFFKDGRLTDEEHQEFINILKKELSPATNQTTEALPSKTTTP